MKREDYIKKINELFKNGIYIPELVFKHLLDLYNANQNVADHFRLLFRQTAFETFIANCEKIIKSNLSSSQKMKKIFDFVNQYKIQNKNDELIHLLSAYLSYYPEYLMHINQLQLKSNLEMDFKWVELELKPEIEKIKSGIFTQPVTAKIAMAKLLSEDQRRKVFLDLMSSYVNKNEASLHWGNAIFLYEKLLHSFDFMPYDIQNKFLEHIVDVKIFRRESAWGSRAKVKQILNNASIEQKNFFSKKIISLLSQYAKLISHDFYDIIRLYSLTCHNDLPERIKIEIWHHLRNCGEFPGVVFELLVCLKPDSNQVKELFINKSNFIVNDISLYLYRESINDLGSYLSKDDIKQILTIYINQAKLFSQQNESKETKEVREFDFKNHVLILAIIFKHALPDDQKIIIAEIQRLITTPDSKNHLFKDPTFTLTIESILHCNASIELKKLIISQFNAMKDDNHRKILIYNSLDWLPQDFKEQFITNLLNEFENDWYFLEKTFYTQRFIAHSSSDQKDRFKKILYKNWKKDAWSIDCLKALAEHANSFKMINDLIAEMKEHGIILSVAELISIIDSGIKNLNKWPETSKISDESKEVSSLLDKLIDNHVYDHCNSSKSIFFKLYSLAERQTQLAILIILSYRQDSAHDYIEFWEDKETMGKDLMSLESVTFMRECNHIESIPQGIKLDIIINIRNQMYEQQNSSSQWAGEAALSTKEWKMPNLESKTLSERMFPTRMPFTLYANHIYKEKIHESLKQVAPDTFVDGVSRMVVRYL